MGYTLDATQKAPLLNALGDPLASAGVTDPDGNHAPFNVGGVAQIQDDGEGFLVCVANSVGTTTFELHSGGTAATHTVTVTASAFDWSLGTPVAQ